MTLKRCRSLDLGVDSFVASDVHDGSFEDVISENQTRKKGRKGRPSLSQPISAITSDYDERSSSGIVSPVKAIIDDCCFCGTVCDNGTFIRCEMCEHHYHLSCCGVGEMDVEGVRKTIDVLGWTCRACRLDLLRELRKLRLDFDQLKCKPCNCDVTNNISNETSKSRNAMMIEDKTGHMVAHCSKDVQDDSTIVNSAQESRTLNDNSGSRISYSNIVKLVTKTVKISNLRKKNVIVTGL